MMQYRPSDKRGHTEIGWLKSWHSFSFGEYYDPYHMGFSSLRVINEDIVAAGQGFAEHGHRNMEIITYVLEGELRHQDSLGNGTVIRPGEVQRMSAGSGVRHSEYNPSETDPIHLLQIWIEPELENVSPSYEQKAFGAEKLENRFHLVVSRDGRDGSLRMNQSAEMYAGRFDAGQNAAYDTGESRHIWLQMARGQALCEGTQLKAGDGAGFKNTRQIHLQITEPAEILLFDLP